MEYGLPKFNSLILIVMIILYASLIGILVPLVSLIQEKQNGIIKNITQRYNQQQKQQNQLNHIKGMYTFKLYKKIMPKKKSKKLFFLLLFFSFFLKNE